MEGSCSMATVAVSLAGKIEEAGGWGSRMVEEGVGEGARTAPSSTAWGGASRRGAAEGSGPGQGVTAAAMRMNDCRSTMLTAERGAVGGAGMTMSDLTTCMDEHDDVCYVQEQEFSMSG